MCITEMFKGVDSKNITMLWERCLRNFSTNPLEHFLVEQPLTVTLLGDSVEVGAPNIQQIFRAIVPPECLPNISGTFGDIGSFGDAHYVLKFGIFKLAKPI